MSTTSVTSAPDTAGPPQYAVPDADLPVVGRRHPWRWVGVGIVLVLLAMFVHGLVTNPGGSVSIVGNYPSSATAWTVDALETDNYIGNWSITAYAICAT